ncbi:peptidoglycan editing factor PgeF [Alteromonas sp. ASW11-19]|uniref:Purine nucleoside phosphorylase n=1 Tax=Alteromonas salexigens TaxID=2982530 RepID=A0ABT2VS97_9ALTE|nr:peptidoglycan editing factor PgeF [Alteromonas salexigens]MCU7555782.1 peptidoglycan editing factor PgeF [Alteromonas salexigens]
MINLITPDWPAPQSVVAYTTTRAGGASSSPYTSLNVGLHVGDNPARVTHNRSLLPHHEKIGWLNQVHGSRVVTLPATDIEADAAISRSRDAFCAVMTADCVPVLLTNRQGNEVAAVHAGWQGLEKQVIAATVAAMRSSSDSLLAWIGPAISVRHYEVPSSLAAKFSTYTNVTQPATSADKVMLDLPQIALQQLQALGIAQISQSPQCTYADSKLFFSHRRSQHEGATSTGRMVSVIGFR